MKVTGGFNPISLKKENLTVVDESKQPPIDWTLVDGPKKATSDIASVIRTISKVGNLDRCDEFVRVLQQYVNHQGLHIPVGRYNADDQQMRAMVTNNISNHCVYIFRFDQIGHHFVMEVQQGKARMYQSFVRDQVYVEYVNAVMEMGFSAREWINPQPQTIWPPSVKAVHQKFGGGKELSYLQFIEVLDIIREIQHAAKVITNRYREILPDDLVKGEDKWEAKLMKSNGQSADTSPIGDWANHCFYHPWMTSILILDDGTGDVLVKSNEAYNRSDEFMLTFPATIATPFREAVKKLHGMEPSPVNYIMLFRFRNWEKMLGIDELTGQTIPIGWTCSALTIPH